MRVWTQYQDEVVHSTNRPATFQLMIKRRLAALSREEIDALLKSHPLPARAAAFRDWATDPIDFDMVLGAVARFRTILDRMGASLAAADWLAGDRFSLADVAMALFVDRITHLGMAWLWDDRPRVAAWVGPIEARPSYVATQPAEHDRLPSPAPGTIAEIRRRHAARVVTNCGARDAR